MERLGRLLARRRVPVLVLAALAAVLAGLFGADVNGHLSGGGFTDPNAESSRANNAVTNEFHAGDANLVVIVDAPAGGTVDDPLVAGPAARLAQWAGQADGVTSVRSYWTDGRPGSLRSTDHRQGLIALHLAGSEDRFMNTAHRLTPQLTDHAGGLRLRFAGDAQIYRELSDQTEHDLQTAEAIATPVTLALLVLVFGSAVAALLPVLIGGLSILSTMAVLKIIASTTSVSVYSLNLTTALGLGLAIDYGLFILTRFREELAARGGDRAAVPDAVAATMRTAGRTVLFSAVTVALALAALLVFPQYFLRSIGYGGIAVVLLAAAGALLVLPALLAVLGPRVNALDVLAPLRRRQNREHRSEARSGAVPESAPGSGRRRRERREATAGFWHGLAGLVMRRPVPFGLAVIGLLLVLGAPFWHISFGMVDDRQLPRSAQAQQASQQLRTRFDGSDVRSLAVLLRGTAGTDTAPLSGYAARLSGLPGVSRVDTATGSFAHGRQVAPPGPTSAGFGNARDSWLSVVGTADPQSPAAGRLVHRVRAVPAPHPVLVGGRAAVLADTRAELTSRLPYAAGIIVAATMLLLFLFTGSVLMPVKAVLLNVLSLSATFGALVFVFQDGHLGWLVGHPIVTGSLDMTIPVVMFCVAFGVSMDYEVFLLSRIREDYLRTGDNRHAVATGLQRTGRLITAAAALIALVLLAFATSQVTLLRMMGGGLALAVVVDATLVRGILVPAFMRLAGRANWWAPGPLRRLHRRIGISESDEDPAPAPEPEPVSAGAGAR